MGKIIVVFMLLTALSIALLPAQVRATDGDMDYSSPYITVDPETGQLVTKNPGPKLKTHSQDMSSQGQTGMTTAKTDPVVVQPAVNGSGEVATPDNDQMGSASILTIIAVTVIVFGALAFWRFRQQQ